MIVAAELYDWLVLVHIVAAMVWVGGGAMPSACGEAAFVVMASV